MARVHVLFAALAIAVGLVSVTSARAGAAACPAVDAGTGAVTPAPAPNVDWAGCDLAGANLSNAELGGANLSGANLTGANLTTAQTLSANFAGANLTNATAVAAALEFADFKGAIFNGTDLQAASLSDADLFQATGLSSANTDSVTWTHATCPNGASADYYTGGCLGTVSVTTPSATPVITGGRLGANGWYTSAVTVTWHWIDANALAAGCPASTTSAGQGSKVPITASCGDSAGHTGTATVSEPIDTTPPVVTLTGVRNGAVFPMGRSPMPQCDTTDALSGVRYYAITTIAVGRPDGTGVATVICSDGEDQAGNVAPSFTAHWTVLYLFGGFYAPKPGSTLSHTAKSVLVKAFLADEHDKAIPAATQSGLAAHQQVRATLRGAGIAAVTVTCGWNAKGKYLQCAIPTPRKVRTGHKNRYTITMAENLGSGWRTVPADARSENPEPVYFK
jgi:hypothetical protein